MTWPTGPSRWPRAIGSGPGPRRPGGWPPTAAQFADAVAWADHCLARGPGDWNRELPAHLVRAMALARLGRRDEAGAARARASDLYRTKVANPGGRAAGGDWHDQVICEILGREAAADFLDRDLPADPFAR